MAGNWVGPAFDPLVGDVLEFTHLDDEGQDQGNSVGLVQSFTPGAGYMVNLLWIHDMSLKDWLLSDEPKDDDLLLPLVLRVVLLPVRLSVPGPVLPLAVLAPALVLRLVGRLAIVERAHTDSCSSTTLYHACLVEVRLDPDLLSIRDSSWDV